MKRIIILSLLLVGLMAVYGYADQGGHMTGGMMGSPGYGGTQDNSQENPVPGYGRQGMMGPGMMGYGMGPGMMGYGGPGMMGYGMGPGMMGYGGQGMMGHHQMMHGGYGMGGMMMGPGMMGYGGCGNMGYGGYGMMRPGMMGYGGQGMMGHHQTMHGGYGMGPGMMGYGGQGYNAEAYQKFMDETLELRKKMHTKKFEYSEALRNPKTTREDIIKMEKEFQELQKEMYEKRQK
jgi:hypothetical protein